MDRRIPRKSEWCVYCYRHKHNAEDKDYPCDAHPDGKDYTGSDAYDPPPSSGVFDTVGHRFKNVEGLFWLCYGYDPRTGFWMKSEETGEVCNVSERAIGRTYHRVLPKFFDRSPL